MSDFRLETRADARPLKKLHGVNNGPITFGELVDNSDHFRAAGFPLVRLHDPNWPNTVEVDIHAVFPDLDADPEDPASYDFARTDAHLETVFAVGAEVVYRLGESIEHTKVKHYVKEPRDYEKWARICSGIIAHYNEGWADGFHHGIRYWEIWNEPEGEITWPGPWDRYLSFYATVARALRERHPDVKLGGPAAFLHLEKDKEFLAYCAENAVPLDFFSWHAYVDDPEDVRRFTETVEGWLAEYGLDDVEVHLNEWNFIAHSTGALPYERLFAKDAGEVRRVVYSRMTGIEGATFAASVLSLLQDHRVDQANYYDAQGTNFYCGLFDAYGAPLPTYRVFERFNRMCGLAERVDVVPSREIAGLYPLAVRDGDRTLVWLANFSATDAFYTVDLGVPAGTAVTASYLRRDDRDFSAPERLEADAEGRVALYLAKPSVTVLEIGAAS